MIVILNEIASVLRGGVLSYFDILNVERKMTVSIEATPVGCDDRSAALLRMAAGGR